MKKLRPIKVSDSTVRRVWVFTVVLAAAVFLATFLALRYVASESKHFEEQDRQSRADREQIRELLAQEATARKALEEQLKQLGQQPVIEPDDVPEDAEVVVIPGEQGPKGDRGESCIEEIGYPRCRGAEGESGSDGADGAAGLDGADGADGAPGPKGDKGDPGADGKDGVDGKDGRGIADLQCGPDGRWTVTYTDGTTGDAGVCRVGPGNPNEGARR